MSNTVSRSADVSAAPAEKPPQLPYLLTPPQGEAARALVSHVASLALPDPDARLVAAVVAIRAARGGVGNVSGADLAALRLGDARQAVGALRGLGWEVPDGLLDGDPATPWPVTVPDLAPGTDHPLPLGKNMRSRVSGWAARTLSAKPVKKLPPAARLAGLFLAAHSTPGLQGPIPPELPEACRAALPDLLSKGFLAELSQDRCRLAPAVRHLSGRRPPTEAEEATEPPEPDDGVVIASTPGFTFDADAWAGWKASATPGLRRHAESVEYCAMCALRVERVAEAFMVPVRARATTEKVAAAFAEWRRTHSDPGPLAAEFTLAFRDRHGHGPSYGQLSAGLNWSLKAPLRGLVVGSLVTDEWLTGTGTVPWTLRPGLAAEARGIALPRARGPVTVVRIEP
ncbi:hypothetical protein OG875_05725 [Streptomyces sp. NBC_01498]|uniref:hypothetical protein n=1 Tax=Streptomyces sp. NBC_01498 TaxID=2975870 RepID=UPI002E7C06E0|nr:hypothetical protein [Streptomyces sp. NBC_01498]WTL24153.1 hypothetical protein OG875_05725 [Streptomyces sp. NBC_01498]